MDGYSATVRFDSLHSTSSEEPEQSLQEKEEIGVERAE
jgi:hypothetical protein